MPNDRSSEADHPQLVTDPKEIARIEAENTLRQFDESMSELAKWISNPGYYLRVSTILRLNRIALGGVSAYAGIFRPSSITITGSGHVPPDAGDVPALMEDFCDYITGNWQRSSAIHLSAYALWRLNWIHPFVDGNGRTARSVSYLILCAKLGYRLPGRNTIPEQIAAAKKPYYTALEAGDKAEASGTIDVSDLERLLDEQLARQLLLVHETATGSPTADRMAVAATPSVVSHPYVSRKRPPGILTNVVGHVERHPVVYTCAVALIVGIAAIIFQK